MINKFRKDPLKEMDQRELELPETLFSRDIESKVFQSIVLQCIRKIEGVSLLEGTLIDDILGREALDRIKGISIEQDLRLHSVSIEVEVNVLYGASIPEKAEEIQNKIVEEVSSFTGLHVSRVHVIFKNLFLPGMKSIPETEENIKVEEVASVPYGDGF
jgi:uncharacterized alkaline shock family protein YloU